MSQPKLLPNEIKLLQKTMSANPENTSIRLREGEYQHSLVKAVASFQLELYFPDVKDITRRLYGEDRTNDLQFIRKIQTILKKMEKSNIVTILPKKKPWELQRYALSSFKFQDSDKNLVVFATDQEISQSQNLLQNQSSEQDKDSMNYRRFFVVAAIAVVSYIAILWSLLQPIINPLVFIPALSISIMCSLMLGKILSRE